MNKEKLTKEVLTVILVDDNLEIREILKFILSNHPKNNIKVIGEAENGKDGLSIIKKLLPDVTIIDISMPVMNGMDLLKKLYVLKIDTNCIMYSNNLDKEYIEFAKSYGAKAFISKDCSPQIIVDTVINVSKGMDYLIKK